MEIIKGWPEFGQTIMFNHICGQMTMHGSSTIGNLAFVGKAVWIAYR